MSLGYWRVRLGRLRINSCVIFMRNALRSIKNALVDTRFRLGAFGVIPTAGQRRLLSLKNRHSNRRAFIIGNGPSLSVDDLAKIEGEVSFGSNKVFLAFDKTAWRPTYYCIVDRLVAQSLAGQLDSMPFPKYISDDCRRFVGKVGNVVFLHEFADNAYLFQYADAANENPIKCKFSEDMAWGVHGGSTVVYTQMQMAYYMGIKEVILLGLDFSFSIPKATVDNSAYGVALKSEGERNHFHPDYRKPGDVWAVPRLDQQIVAFKAAKRVFEAVGGRIVNASRHTKLDVFERVSFDDIIKGK